MTHAKNLMTAAALAAMLVSLSEPLDAQPTMRPEQAKEHRDEKRDEKRETVAERLAKYNALKEKEKGGTLTDEEKKDLERLEQHYAKVKKNHDMLKTRYEKFKQSFETRRRAQKRSLLRLWGKEMLRKAPVREELELNAKRMARLNRVRDLAQAEVDTEALARINQLVRKERERHERRMNQLKVAP
jgi:uncharacterized protein YnzC (UPF0291/DUF896 family)